VAANDQEAADGYGLLPKAAEGNILLPKGRRLAVIFQRV